MKKTRKGVSILDNEQLFITDQKKVGKKAQGRKICCYFPQVFFMIQINYSDFFIIFIFTQIRIMKEYHSGQMTQLTHSFGKFPFHHFMCR